MTPGMRIAAAVVGGYVLGRRKKAKLAITMGGWIAGKKLNLNPQKVLTDLTQELGSSPELAGLRDQVRNELFSAGRTAATTVLTQQAGRLTSSLQERTDRLQTGADNALSDTDTSEPDTDDAEPADERTTESAAGRKGAEKRASSGKQAAARSRSGAQRRR